MKFYCYNNQEGMKPHETLEAAKQAAIEATERAASTSADPEATATLWGEVHGCSFVELVRDIDGGMVAACSVVDCHLASDAEIERLRAELAAFRARVAAVLAELQGMEAHHRQTGNSLAHGEYSFERAEAYEHAADMLKEALTMGGEE